MGVGTPVGHHDILCALTVNTDDIHGGVSLRSVSGGLIVNSIVNTVLVTEVLLIAVFVNIIIVTDEVHTLGLYLAIVHFSRLAVQNSRFGSINTLCAQHTTVLFHVSHFVTTNSGTGVGMGGGHVNIFAKNTGLSSDGITDKVPNRCIDTLQVPGHEQICITVGVGHTQGTCIQGIMDRGRHSVRRVCRNTGNRYRCGGRNISTGKADLEAFNFRGLTLPHKIALSSLLLLSLRILLGAGQQRQSHDGN